MTEKFEVAGLVYLGYKARQGSRKILQTYFTICKIIIIIKCEFKINASCLTQAVWAMLSRCKYTILTSFL